MLLPLCKVVALDNNKRWMATEGAQVLLHEFKERVFQARRPKNSAEGAYQFRLQGNAWTVTYDGKTAMVDDSRGVRFIAYLLAHPGKSIPIATVLEAVDGQPKVAGSNGVLLDTQAQQAYRERLQELEEEIAEAKRFADLARHEHLCQEHETIVTELTATQGLKGRQRVSSDTDRFRRKVKMAISRSMDFFKGRLPEFYHHLRGSLHTGFTLCYAPDTTIPWTL
jgi:hypothetical protein